MKLFHALVQRRKESDNKERLNAGIIATAVYNTAPFGDPDREPVNPLQFVPDWSPEGERSPDLTTLTPEQQKMYFFNIFSKRRWVK